MTEDRQAGGSGGIKPAHAVELAEQVDFAEGAVVSRALTKGESGTVTLFAFAEGQDLSEHTAPFDAYVIVIEGRMAINIGETALDAEEGEIVLMPANVPHALAALEDTKMLLIMLRS